MSVRFASEAAVKSSPSINPFFTSTCPSAVVSPAVIGRLPHRVHEAYTHAVAASLHPIFVVAAGIAMFAFVLTWLLREVPLRDSTRPARGQELAGAASAETAAVTRSPSE